MKPSLLDHTKPQHDVPSHHVFYNTHSTGFNFPGRKIRSLNPTAKNSGFLCSSTKCRQPGLQTPSVHWWILAAEVTADQEMGCGGCGKEFCCLTAPLVLSFGQVSFFQPESCMSKPPNELRHPAPHPKQRFVPQKSLLPAAQTAQRGTQEWALRDIQFRRS